MLSAEASSRAVPRGGQWPGGWENGLAGESIIISRAIVSQTKLKSRGEKNAYETMMMKPSRTATREPPHCYRRGHDSYIRPKQKRKRNDFIPSIVIVP
jgi:hypothetical protein